MKAIGQSRAVQLSMIRVSMFFRSCLSPCVTFSSYIIASKKRNVYFFGESTGEKYTHLHLGMFMDKKLMTQLDKVYNIKQLLAVMSHPRIRILRLYTHKNGRRMPPAPFTAVSLGARLLVEVFLQRNSSKRYPHKFQ